MINNTIEQFLDKLDRVRDDKRGGWMARCPAHDDGNPSLHITVSGDAILLQCFAGCETEDIVKALDLSMRDLFLGDRRSGRALTPVYVRPDQTWIPKTDDQRLGEWLMSRGLSQLVAEELGVGGDGNVVHFPIYRYGELLNVKTRINQGDTKTFRLVTGAEVAPFNLDACLGEDRVYVVEGECDVIAATQAGCKAVMSIPNGANLGKNNLDWVVSAEHVLRKARQVVIATDADEPGRKVAIELAERIGKERCLIVEWPQGCNDANDVLRTHGPQELARCLQSAIPAPIEGLYRPSDLRSSYAHLFDHGRQRGTSLGLSAEFDRYFTVTPGAISLWSGVPNSGKSELLDMVMVSMAIREGWRFIVFSPENEPVEEHLSRMAEKYQRSPFFPGPANRMSWQQAEDSLDYLDKHISFIRCEEPTIDNVLKYAEAEAFRVGAKGLVLDPWNELTHKFEQGEREDQYLSRSLSVSRQFFDRRGMHGFFVNHPHAMKKNAQSGQYDPVDLYDLHGGSMWSNKVSGFVSIWRDRIDQNAPVKVYVKKARSRRIGRLGRCDFSYDPVTGIYRQVPGGFEDGG